MAGTSHPWGPGPISCAKVARAVQGSPYGHGLDAGAFRRDIQRVRLVYTQRGIFGPLAGALHPQRGARAARGPPGRHEDAGLPRDALHEAIQSGIQARIPAARRGYAETRVDSQLARTALRLNRQRHQRQERPRGRPSGAARRERQICEESKHLLY